MLKREQQFDAKRHFASRWRFAYIANAYEIAVLIINGRTQFAPTAEMYFICIEKALPRLRGGRCV